MDSRPSLCMSPYIYTTMIKNPIENRTAFEDSAFGGTGCTAWTLSTATRYIQRIGASTFGCVDLTHPLTMGILAWIFGDKIQARAFTIAVVAELYHLLERDHDLTIQKGMLNYAWRYTAQESSLRQLLIRWISASVNTENSAALLKAKHRIIRY